jgi:hypothetical protein
MDPLTGVNRRPRFGGREPRRTADGTAYTVRVIQPEGTGVTTLVLEKQWISSNDPVISWTASRRQTGQDRDNIAPYLFS